MPLTEKGQKILNNMTKEYGSREKAERVLYAGKNKGTFTGIDDCGSYMDACRKGDAVGMRHAAARMMRRRVVR
jgi:hypothetical protein